MNITVNEYNFFQTHHLVMPYMYPLYCYDI